MNCVTVYSDYGVLETVSGAIHWLLQNNAELTASVDASPAGFLNEDEIAIWRSFKIDKRRRDWLLGRRTAKRLVGKIIQESKGRELPLDQITVLPHRDGWPIVSLKEGNFPITLSISHSHDWAFCAAIVDGGDCPLGADIEFVEPRADAFIEDYFTPLEQRFLVTAPPEQRLILTNAIWSGKEAALKAIRRGLAEDTRLVSCLPHPYKDERPQWLPMRLVWSSDGTRRGLPHLTGRWRLEGDFVLTLAAIAE